MEAFLLTTEDNPFDPVTEFSNWYTYDISHGYYTCERIARLSGANSDMTPAEYQRCVNGAIDDLVKYNVPGNYKKIVLNDDDDNKYNTEQYDTKLE